MSLPSIQEIIEQAKTPEGRDNIVSNFRTKTHNLSIEEALILKQQLDEDVGELVQQIEVALNEAYKLEDNSSDHIWELKSDVISAYGYDGYDDGVWIDSGY